MSTFIFGLILGIFVLQWKRNDKEAVILITLPFLPVYKIGFIKTTDEWFYGRAD